MAAGELDIERNAHTRLYNYKLISGFLSGRLAFHETKPNIIKVAKDDAYASKLIGRTTHCQFATCASRIAKQDVY